MMRTILNEDLPGDVDERKRDMSMGAISKIDWCDSTWNPVTGCLHGCEYCYARRIAERFGGSITGAETVKRITIADGRMIWDLLKPIHKTDGKISPYPCGFVPTFHRYKLDEPQKWKKGRNIFVCSMADLFGDWVPDSWIEEVFAACEKAPRHRYLFLTKNPQRYIDLAMSGKLPSQHWYGYTATRQNELWMFRHADDCPVRNLFVSMEPMLEKIEPCFSTHCPADWVIIGAETGKRKGKVVPRKEWIEHIAMECEYSGRPLFMKDGLADIWGESLIQEYPDGLRKEHRNEGN